MAVKEDGPNRSQLQMCGCIKLPNGNSCRSHVVAEFVRQAGGEATHIADRDVIAARLVREAEAGDVILIMGARDDSLIAFAQGIVTELQARD